jgi:hypothetical protein
MAGLNFQTQTIINSNVDIDSSVNGTDVVLFEKVTTKIDGVEVADVVRIKRDFTFVPEYIKSVSTRAGYKEEHCEAEINFTTLLNSIKPAAGETKYCRLEIYVTVQGAEPFMYSNPFAQKGKPFWIEFAVTANDTAETVAKNVYDLIKKHDIFVLDKNSIAITLSGAVVKLVGNMEYQRFGDITIHVFDMYSGDANKVAKLDKNTGAAIQLKKEGLNGFGTYSHLIKDLRLPTAANTTWTALRQAETPIVGALYTQFIVEYCAPSQHFGMQAVGQKMMSHTTHVFWVKSDVANDFKALFPADKITVVAKDGTVTPPTVTEASELDE